jgi:hypothetical protein
VLAGSENLNDLRYLLTRVAAVQGRAGEFRGRSYQSVRAAFRLADPATRPPETARGRARTQDPSGAS